MKKELNIKDIANLANISVSTASRAINNKGRVTNFPLVKMSIVS